MGLHSRRSVTESLGSPHQPVEEWPFLDQSVLLPSRSRKVCMTCHGLRHHSSVNCVPLLTCQLHQGLLPQGGDFQERCHSWVASQAT
jgi:hypothetical protein